MPDEDATVTLWNRLEGRPRAENFDRALKAEVRDALWVLTRQWQMGEFRGDDAASPVETKIRVTTTRLRKYRADGGVVEEHDDSLPLETGQPYFLHEEEVPRAGIIVTQQYQRTRWRGGRVWLWLGARKKTGRGEGASGLAFDRALDVPPR